MTQRFLPYRPERDVYRLLQVDPRAGTAEILDAWRRLARTFHPDRNGSGRATEEMQVVNAVRELLTDPSARAQYDRERRRFMSGPRHGVPAAGAPRAGLGGAPRALADRGVPLARTARALGTGLAAFGAALLPLRCERCAGAIGRRDVRCSICGFPTGAPRG